MSSHPSSQRGIDRYWSALRALRPGLLAAAAVSAVISVLMLTGSLYMLQVYDRVLASGSVPTLLGLFLIVAILYGFLGYYDFLRARMLSRLSLRLEAALGPQAFSGWLASANPASQPLRDLEVLRGFVGGPAMSGLFDLPWVPLYLAVLFAVHAWLGWLTIAGAGIVAALAWLGHRLTRAPIARNLTAAAVARDYADASQRSADMVLAMGMQHAITTRWRQLQDISLASGQHAGAPSESLGAASRAFRMLMQSAILSLGAYLVIMGQMSGGMIIASSILTGRALAPVDMVISQWRSIGKALESHQRLQGFFASLPASAEVLALPAPSGQISVRNLLKFAPSTGPSTGPSTPGAERPALLEGVSFDLDPGDALGVIGASASGKSTLARLLAGAWQADGGEIRLDAATRQQWDPAILGRHIGYLPQQVDLLPGTLRDNIARFDPARSDAEVIEAATAAGVHEMILHLPDGYASRVGGMGAALPLSGGQVQRIGLARALCGAPSLVILDEPNAHLDTAGEANLIATIAALRARGAVVIVMAHRAAVLAATNKLLILQGGRMVEFGARDALLAAHETAAAPGRTPVGNPVGNPVAAPTPEPASLPPTSSSPAAARVARSRPPGAAPENMRRVRALAARSPATAARPQP